jgi:hypothetical protein
MDVDNAFNKIEPDPVTGYLFVDCPSSAHKRFENRFLFPWRNARTFVPYLDYNGFLSGLLFFDGNENAEIFPVGGVPEYVLREILKD